MDDHRVRDLYAAYSAQDLERLLSFLTDDVDWPDGDRRMRGTVEVRRYWIEQWRRVQTRDVPAVVVALSDTVRVVRIDQTVVGLTGEVVSRGTFAHLLHLDGERVARLDIVPL